MEFVTGCEITTCRLAQIVNGSDASTPLFLSTTHPMIQSAAVPSSTVERLPSAQTRADETPRFHVPAQIGQAGWEAAAAQECDGGVAAEVRVFLDAQLETGDVLLDVAPGFGFVALSGATAPNGVPTVLVAGLSPDRLQSLQDAASDAGGWIDQIDTSANVDLHAQLDARLDTAGRIFVHVAAVDVAETCTRLSSLIAQGRVLAICVSDAHDPVIWAGVDRALRASQLIACVMMVQDGDPFMVPLVGTPATPIIALPAALAPRTIANDVVAISDAIDESINDAIDEDVSGSFADSFGDTLVDDLFPAPTAERAWDTPTHLTLVGGSDSRWLATRDGLSLISSHSRTGYGVTGAHLLRALQQRGVPVAFFPLGMVDRALAGNSQLQQAITLQDAFRSDVPSVRLSQQFDLAMHVGRGAHVAYTIFELDTFTQRELHHLTEQDAIFVCSDWARHMCLVNGLADKPIHIVPLGVDRSIFNERIQPRRRWPETVFMQIGKLEPRKGQLDLLRAFEAAFSSKDAVRLVLACGNPFIARDELDRQLIPFRTSPMANRITLVTGELPTQMDVAELMAAADCGVFAARAEGWNLEALEMLSMGKAVIATDYSAHTEFMHAGNARLVSIDHLEPAFTGRHPGRWAAWQEAQHEQLVVHLRDVHTHKQQGSLTDNPEGIATARTFSWESTADALTRALSAIA